ncbi:MAG TPA: hypothetical protein VHW02_05125 [Rhizomicrobium sp.]|nr:hypothetical protein [Rhizomicrobium sp.]
MSLGLMSAAAAQTPPPVPQPDGSCKLHHPSEEVSSFAKMPAPVVAFILNKMRADGSTTTEVMADRGTFFNATDVIIGKSPGRRFIRAGHAANKWFLWYERGGIAYSKSIAIVALNGASASLVAHIGYEHENPCALTDAALDGKAAVDNGLSNWW